MGMSLVIASARPLAAFVTSFGGSTKVETVGAAWEASKFCVASVELPLLALVLGIPGMGMSLVIASARPLSTKVEILDSDALLPVFGPENTSVVRASATPLAASVTGLGGSTNCEVPFLAFS